MTGLWINKLENVIKCVSFFPIILNFEAANTTTPILSTIFCEVSLRYLQHVLCSCGDSGAEWSSSLCNMGDSLHLAQPDNLHAAPDGNIEVQLCHVVDAAAADGAVSLVSRTPPLFHITSLLAFFVTWHEPRTTVFCLALLSGFCWRTSTLTSTCVTSCPSTPW